MITCRRHQNRAKPVGRLRQEYLCGCLREPCLKRPCTTTQPSGPTASSGGPGWASGGGGDPKFMSEGRSSSVSPTWPWGAGWTPRCKRTRPGIYLGLASRTRIRPPSSPSWYKLCKCRMFPDGHMSLLCPLPGTILLGGDNHVPDALRWHSLSVLQKLRDTPTPPRCPGSRSVQLIK